MVEVPTCETVPGARKRNGHREGDRIATNIGGRARSFRILSIEPRLAP